MRMLPRDKRGYPVPYMVLWDNAGRPHFTVNDEEKRRHCLAKDLCAICGSKLFRGRWFVGGPLSAFHEGGQYLDPPLHHECMQYAMQVCPFLAAPSFTRMMDTLTVKAENLDADVTALIDPTVIPDKPEVFVAVMARGQSYRDTGAQIYIRPVRPYIRVEFWRNGVELDAGEGAAIAKEVLERPLPEIKTPRIAVRGRA
jgi:hypothetical protein